MRKERREHRKERRFEEDGRADEEQEAAHGANLTGGEHLVRRTLARADRAF